MESAIKKVFRYIDENSNKFVRDMKKLCRQPSISTQKIGMEKCAQLVRSMLEEAGIKTRVFQFKEGFPIIYGEFINKKATKTLGFYNHYDVQPPDPLDKWVSPPFKPEVREGKFFARGVSDNKGDIVARLSAIKALAETVGEIPVNLKFIIEGEEEVGSPNLPIFVKENKALLQADGYLWETGFKDPMENPMIVLGCKGDLSVEMEAKGPATDQHSQNAPLLPNPAWRLIWALESIKGFDEKIKIEGFYENIEPLTKEELEEIKHIPFPEEIMKKSYGVKEFLRGLVGSEAQKAYMYEPTCNICGFASGYAGTGMKTVLPSIAIAKVDFRLVEAQRGEEIFDKLKAHLLKHGFKDVKVKKLGIIDPAKTTIDAPLVKTVAETTKKVYGKEPIIHPMAPGSSPMYTVRNYVGAPCVAGAGVNYTGANMHAPNENVRITDFIAGIKHLSAVILSY